MKNLHFEDQLGDPSRIFIEFYQSKESRQKLLHQEQGKALQKPNTLNVNSEPFNKLLKDVQGGNIMGAI